MLMRICKTLFSFLRPQRPAVRRQRAAAPPAAPPEKPREVVPRPECSVSHVARTELLTGTLNDALVFALRPGEKGPPAKAPRLRGRWKQDTRHLAMICGDMVALAPELFPGLPVTTEGLCSLVKEVTMLENMVGRATQFVKKLERLLAARKDELCSGTQLIVDTVEGLWKHAAAVGGAAGAGQDGGGADPGVPERAQRQGAGREAAPAAPEGAERGPGGGGPGGTGPGAVGEPGAAGRVGGGNPRLA